MSRLFSKRLIKKNISRILESYNDTQWLDDITGRVRAIIGTGNEDKLNSLVSTIEDMHGRRPIKDEEIVNYIGILEPNLLPDKYSYKTYKLPSTIPPDRISRAISELGIDAEYDPERSILKASENDAKRIIRKTKDLKESYSSYAGECIKFPSNYSNRDIMDMIDDAGYSDAVEIRGNEVYGDETTIRQLRNELDIFESVDDNTLDSNSTDIEKLRKLVIREKEIEDIILSKGFDGAMEYRDEFYEITGEIGKLAQKIDGTGAIHGKGILYKLSKELRGPVDQSSMKESIESQKIDADYFGDLFTDVEKISETEYEVSLPKGLNSIKKFLKSKGFKKVGLTSIGYGFEDDLYAYDGTNPRNSTIILELIAQKSDNRYLLKIVHLNNNESIDEDLSLDDDPEETEQTYSSAATSINSSKLPALFNMVEFEEGSINLDYGGGKFDNVNAYLQEKYGATNLVYDKYNRSAQHNKDVLAQIRQNGGADTVTCSNVLNVIAEESERLAVLRNCKRYLRSGGTCYITVYEGSGSGEGAPTKAGYQMNRKTRDYEGEISQVFSSVTRKGKLFICK